jgi:hypothetical protein
LFWEEVDLEAERLRRQDGGQAPETDDEPASAPATAPDSGGREPQQLIDDLRARVASLAHRLDA